MARREGGGDGTKIIDVGKRGMEHCRLHDSVCRVCDEGISTDHYERIPLT